jgi:hypothetical protein
MCWFTFASRSERECYSHVSRSSHRVACTKCDLIRPRAGDRGGLKITPLARPWRPRAEGVTNHDLWDFAPTAPDPYALLPHSRNVDLDHKQVVKQHRGRLDRAA